jgi:hypothetical protein
MVRPCIGAGRDSSACRLVGRSHSPCCSLKQHSLRCQGQGGGCRAGECRHSCPTRQAIEACLTQFYGLVAVLWMQRNFALARIRGLAHRCIALTNLASTLNGEHKERTTNKPDL